jgi:hypothetical protein
MTDAELVAEYRRLTAAAATSRPLAGGATGVRSEGFDDGVDLVQGDKVWFHHFVVEQDSRFMLFDKQVYKLPYEQIFAVERDGEIIPLNDYVFLEPELQKSRSEALYDTQEGEYSQDYGKVLYLGSEGQKRGLSVGDRVFIEHAPYLMKMNDKDVYRVKCDYIPAIIQ